MGHLRVSTSYGHMLTLSTLSALPVPMLRQVYAAGSWEGQKWAFRVGHPQKMGRWRCKLDVVMASFLQELILGHLGHPWGHLGPSWAHLGSSWGPSWGYLGPS